MEIAFELTGRTPLIMHRDNIPGTDKLEAWRKDPANKNITKRGDDRSPAWTWQQSLYTDGTNVAVPWENISSALRWAGTSVPMSGKKTFKSSTQSGVFSSALYCDFLYNGGQPLPMAPILAVHDLSFDDQMAFVESMGFKLLIKRARIGTGSSRHVRVRPYFDDWSVKGRLTVTLPELTLKVMQQIFEIAGGGGLMDWRPSGKTPGPYGMFDAKIRQI